MNELYEVWNYTHMIHISEASGKSWIYLFEYVVCTNENKLVPTLGDFSVAGLSFSSNFRYCADL